ncbi:MAG: 2-C-methyl-D-erythritol 4-phosphate cytidylyltransferase, partial [Acidimicrobiia bacterium]|nr:2-C-methyl-D-erythritol 4-phosphate cytidylyltransferase [Acidimicrobiia bacterium]
LIPGGPTRTASEMAGLAAVGPDIELIGIHDGARPGTTPQLIEALFNRAAAVGGAVPALSPEGFAIERESKQVISDVVTVQTPQVFRAEVLRDAYACAAREGVSGQDTVELVLRFTDSRVTTVPGEETNMKITYPTDLTRVESALLDRADTGPR